jgi:hypothetical protein
MLGPDERLVLDRRATIGLRCVTDLQEFERLAAQGDAAAALDLCRGVLLAGFVDEWARAARGEHAAGVASLRRRRSASA